MYWFSRDHHLHKCLQLIPSEQKDCRARRARHIGEALCGCCDTPRPCPPLAMEGIMNSRQHCVYTARLNIKLPNPSSSSPGQSSSVQIDLRLTRPGEVGHDRNPIVMELQVSLHAQGTVHMLTTELVRRQTFPSSRARRL